ncbi:50S ribosomal protein L11 methyltransferase [Consotaella salsifontis]|uniref:Ribosomal protein L11 methyltransferase n=1 Tax=Consotaella salsifontis TaxID=1365950 RepID=A0A1T4M8P6_9HYPH|nr:50S ribosomal protein L11 methyltransferase [Consotaella salsifontis]SJZ63302.1 [LSU ribosomal protein L11P]-lysine N-methyltransferase [Consotaella salsifontis]
MKQTRYHFIAPKPDADRAYAVLEAAFEDEGAPLAVAEVDEAAALFEVSLYLDGEDDRRADVEAALAGEAFTIEAEVLPDIDWMSRVLAELKPVRAGRFLVHGAHDRDKVRPGDLAIEIEASEAFGTGHHGTTAGCLEMISRLVARRRPRNALDVGTGTAVLAIALAKLARVPVLASDIDPVAVRVARGNIALNHASTMVDTVVAKGLSAPDIRRRGPFDLIVANILAGPLMMLAPDIARSLSWDGDVVLSGILERQRRAVLAAYGIQGLVHRATIRHGEWATIHLSR